MTRFAPLLLSLALGSPLLGCSADTEETVGSEGAALACAAHEGQPVNLVPGGGLPRNASLEELQLYRIEGEYQRPCCHGDTPERWVTNSLRFTLEQPEYVTLYMANGGFTPEVIHEDTGEAPINLQPLEGCPGPDCAGCSDIDAAVAGYIDRGTYTIGMGEGNVVLVLGED